MDSLMFKALVKQTCGEGIQSYQSPPGEDNLHFSAQEEAAEHILINYGHGIIVTQKGEFVVHV